MFLNNSIADAFRQLLSPSLWKRNWKQSVPFYVVNPSFIAKSGHLNISFSCCFFIIILFNELIHQKCANNCVQPFCCCSITLDLFYDYT